MNKVITENDIGSGLEIVSNKLKTKAITKNDVGLGNLDNTSDVNKPISTDTQIALDNKVDKLEGKELSTNDYTTVEKTKLAGLQNINEQLLVNTTHYVLANQTAKQKIFSNGELVVEAGKTYIFRLEVSLYQFSSYGRSVAFSMLGTANVSNLNLNMTTMLNANTPNISANAPIFSDNAYFTNGQMGFSGTAHIKGSFTASVSGTLIPAFQFDALPGAGVNATAGSYFILKKID